MPSGAMGQVLSESGTRSQYPGRMLGLADQLNRMMGQTPIRSLESYQKFLPAMPTFPNLRENAQFAGMSNPYQVYDKDLQNRMLNQIAGQQDATAGFAANEQRRGYGPGTVGGPYSQRSAGGTQADIAQRAAFQKGFLENQAQEMFAKGNAAQLLEATGLEGQLSDAAARAAQQRAGALAALKSADTQALGPLIGALTELFKPQPFSEQRMPMPPGPALGSIFNWA